MTDATSRPDGTDGHFHERGLHTGYAEHHGYPRHRHTSDGRTHWASAGEPDWQTVAKTAADEMERHARSIIGTANLIRAQLGLGTVIRIGHVKRAESRNKL